MFFVEKTISVPSSMDSRASVVKAIADEYAGGSVSLVERTLATIGHYLEDVPELLLPYVKKEVAGDEQADMYCFDNWDCTVELILDFDWLEKWIEEKLEEAAL